MTILLQPVKRAHKAFLARLDDAIDDALHQAGKEGVREATEHPGYRHKSRRLAEANEYRVMRTGSGKLLRLQNRMPYAAPIDKGSRPHVIEARRAPLLRFYWHKLGRWVSMRRVNHPGNRPYRFLHRGHIVAYNRFLPRMEVLMRGIAAKF